MPTPLQSFLLRRDESSFESLFEEKKSLVWTICVRLLGTTEDAEDAFQAAWARLVEETRNGRIPSTAADDHVALLAVREADALRKRRGRRLQRETTMPEPPDSVHEGAGAKEQLAASELRAAVESLVAALPEKLRLPTQLHYLHGLTQRRVAEILGVPPSTIDTRLASARKQLAPMAEKAGLRDALAVFAAGGMAAAGLVAPPSSLDAATVYASAMSQPATGAAVHTPAKVVLVGGVALAIVAIAFVGIGTKTNGGALNTRPSSAATERSSTYLAGARASDSSLPHRASPVAPPVASNSAPVRSATGLSAPNVSDSPATSTMVQASPSQRRVGLLSVVVLAEDTGEAISGAKVILRTASADERILWTGVDGVVGIDDAPTAQMTVCASAGGYSMESRQMALGETDPVVTMKLRPGATLFGRVTDSDNNPVEGAKVLFNYPGEPICKVCPTTLADGSWIIPNLPRGVSIDGMIFLRDGYLRKDFPEGIKLDPGEERRELNIVMPRTPPVRGVVVDRKTGSPIRGARVVTGYRPDKSVVVTGDNGRFECVPGEAGNLRVIAPGFAMETVRPEQAEPDGELRVELHTGKSVAGRVVDRDGNPVKGVRICPRSHLTDFTGIPCPETDATGRFHLDHMPDDVEIDVYREGSPNQPTIRKVAGRTDLDVILRAGSPIRGIVVDQATGDPVGQFNVRLAWSKEPLPEHLAISASPHYFDPGTSYESGDGRFEFGNFAEGIPFGLRVSAEGFETAEVDRIVPNPKAEPVSIKLKKVPSASPTGS